MNEDEIMKPESFRLPYGLAERVKQKAEMEGKKKSEVYREFAESYVGFETELDELEKQEKNLEKEKSRIKTELKQVRKEIERLEEENKMDKKIVDYFSGKFQKQSSEIQKKRIREFAEQCEMEPKEFVEWAEEEVEEFNGFDGFE